MCIRSVCTSGRMVGREVIIESYRKDAEWARATFDRAEFESEVEPLGDGRFLITYTDPPGTRRAATTSPLSQPTSIDVSRSSGSTT